VVGRERVVAFSCLCLAGSLGLGQSEEDGRITLVGCDRSVPVLGESYDSERESNIAWIVFRFDRKHRSRYLGELFRGQAVPGVSQIKLGFEFVIKFPLGLGVCGTDKVQSSSTATPSPLESGVPGPSFLEDHLKRAVDSLRIPVWHQGEGVNEWDSILISSDYILDDVSFHSPVLSFFQLSVLDRLTGEAEGRGHLFLYDLDQSRKRDIGVRAVVKLSDPSWKVIEKSAAARRFRRLIVKISHDQALLQKSYLDRCTGGDDPPVSTDGHTAGTGDIYDSGSPSAVGRHNDNSDNDCEISFMH